MMQLPTEFSELLRLLNVHEVRYLVVGGYAVAYHGYPPPPAIWISGQNAQRTYEALQVFGFGVPALKPAFFTQAGRIIRMGHPPLRVEILTSASGVDFGPCYAQRVVDQMGGISASILGLDCLKRNKKASGRLKDLDDLEKLP
ncbi:MAG: hypothetical protein AAGI71_13960 [Bacteroidota bacterium]